MTATCLAGVTATSPDSIPAPAQLIRQLAADVCQRLATDKQQAAFATMSPPQAQDIFERVLSATIKEKDSSIRQIAQRSDVPNAYERLLRNLATLVSVQLIKTCPDASTLYGRFAGARSDAPTPAEQALVQSWGDELCQRLADLQKAGRLQGKTSAECIELFHQEYNASLAKRGPQIMQLYGADGNSQLVVDLLSNRITQYMQQHCLQTLLLLRGTDAK
ncbi:hypothetical protein MUN82_18895 [Hymenobacter aerilatus]|uniref:Uncharacterized protein n=1 Tax=Hymenobacter aerilatus TaxID=2932251 RepID=A0A8T9SUF7_9BACT|nr:hypothetical protein [Hymenobacter aerilatus]UOR04991.1 hypothetical protein MUN82_18895 [Hymenobacter aerilatus]